MHNDACGSVAILDDLFIFKLYGQPSSKKPLVFKIKFITNRESKKICELSRKTIIKLNLSSIRYFRGTCVPN